MARQPISQRDWDDAHLINTAVDIHHDDPEFGYRFITDELARKGVKASRNRVNRLCTAQRIWSVHSRKRGLNRRPGPPVHDDRVLRRFTAQRPNELWLTDITEHPTAEGKLHLCAVKDVCSNRIVGYSMDSRMTADLAVRALQHAVALRGPAGTIVHSDRGSQFRAHVYVRALRSAQLHGSMGRVGACADNAAMESFFSLLQKNVLDRAGPPATTCAPHRVLDRVDLPPPAPSGRPRQTHPDRVRDTSADRSRGLTAPTETSQPESGQSRQGEAGRRHALREAR